MGIRDKMAVKAAEMLAGSIDKETFLPQLKAQWKELIESGRTPVLPLDQMVDEAETRIRDTGFEAVFKKAGVTRGDIRSILSEILEE